MTRPSLVDTFVLTEHQLRDDRNPHAREGMTATQARRYPTRRTWTIESPLGRSTVYESLGRWDGPTLVVVGGHHGDEPAGSIAAGLIAQHATAHFGRLVTIPRANPSASEIFSRYGQLPGEDDLNRGYQVPASSRDAYCAATLHAMAILSTVQAVDAAAVIDLHETSFRHSIGLTEGQAAGLAFWCFADAELDRVVARDIGIPVVPAPPILTSLTSNTSRLGMVSLAVETRDDALLGERVRLHVGAVLALAARCGLRVSMPASALDVFP